jgi:hypothetical protein
MGSIFVLSMLAATPVGTATFRGTGWRRMRAATRWLELLAILSTRLLIYTFAREMSQSDRRVSTSHMHRRDFRALVTPHAAFIRCAGGAPFVFN